MRNKLQRNYNNKRALTWALIVSPRPIDRPSANNFAMPDITNNLACDNADNKNRINERWKKNSHLIKLIFKMHVD